MADSPVFEASLVGIGDPQHLDLGEYAGKDVLIFTAPVEEIRKAAPLFRGPHRLHAETPLILASEDLLAALEEQVAEFDNRMREYVQLGDEDVAAIAMQHHGARMERSRAAITKARGGR